MSYAAVPSVVTGQIYSAANYNTYVKGNIDAIWVYTTQGDIVYASSASALARLGIGAANTLLKSTGSAPAWAALSSILGAAAMVVSQAAGDLFYAISGTAIGRLAKGTALQILRMNAGATAPEWADLDAFPAGGSAYQGVRQNAAANAKEWAALLNLLGRQGGSDTIWNNAGTGNRALANALVQVGAVSLTMSGGPPAAAGPVTVTFPVAFSYAPLIFLSLQTGGAGFSSGVWTQLEYNNLSATSFDLFLAQNANSSSYNPRVVNWMAIGPK